MEGAGRAAIQLEASSKASHNALTPGRGSGACRRWVGAKVPLNWVSVILGIPRDIGVKKQFFLCILVPK